MSGVQTFSGQFAGPVVLADVVANSEGWSSGAFNVMLLPIQATITSPWTIVNWTLTTTIALENSTGGQAAGLLGKLYGGLIRGSVVPRSQGAFGPPISLPADQSLIAEIWDGSQDSAAWNQQPLQNALGTFYAVSEEPPIPLTLGAGDQIGIGLWLTRSLGAPLNDNGQIAINVLQASWTINCQSGS